MGQPLIPESSTSLPPGSSSTCSKPNAPRQEDMTTEPPQRLQRRKVLVPMELEIEALQSHKLNISQLRNLNILVQPISLDRASGRKPQFFKPHPSLPQPDDERLNRTRSVLDLEGSSTFCFTDPVDRARQVENGLSSYTFQWTFGAQFDRPWSSKSVGDYKPYKSLYQHDQPEFGTFRMTDIPGEKFPHTMAVMYNDLETNDNEILRGELLTILRLMLGQYRKRRFIAHMTVPVLLFSLMGKCGRIIEAHCDGQRLILRSTALYNFRDQTVAAYKDFAEWYLGEPIGDTH